MQTKYMHYTAEEGDESVGSTVCKKELGYFKSGMSANTTNAQRVDCPKCLRFLEQNPGFKPHIW